MINIKNVDKRIITVLGVIIVLVVGLAGYWFFLRVDKGDGVKPEEPKLPPEIIITSASLATSTNELTVAWNIINRDIIKYNTGLRYDFISHATTTPNSETYPQIKFPPEINSSGDFEVRVDMEDKEEIFYRIQVAFDNEFLWSDEQTQTLAD